MSRATLKASIGEGGAFIGDSHGENNLRDVLTAMARVGEALNAYQETIAAEKLNGMIVDKASKLTSLRIAVATTGTAGQTDVDVLVDGVSKGQLVILNTEADGTSKSLALDEDLPAGSLVQLEVTAAPTGGVGLTATARLTPVSVEAQG